MATNRTVRKLTPKELVDPEREARQKQQIEIRKNVYAAADRLAKKKRESIVSLATEAIQLPADASEADYLKEMKHFAKLRAAFLRETTNPLELHLFACNWNCDHDAGVQPLYKIITHPHCDAGTALWLYWENDPYYAMAFLTIKDADDWEQPLVQLSRTIERRFLRNDFATSKIPFNPEPWVTHRYDSAEWAAHTIPDVMYTPVGIKRRGNGI